MNKQRRLDDMLVRFKNGEIDFETLQSESRKIVVSTEAKRFPIFCQWCGKQGSATKQSINSGKGKFCSRKCTAFATNAARGWTGKPKQLKLKECIELLCAEVERLGGSQEVLDRVAHKRS